MADWLSSAEIAAHRPVCSSAEARRLLEAHYGLEATVSTLPSDRDVNFRVLTQEGLKFVLKLTSTVSTLERLEFELQVLARLKDALGSIRVPVLVETASGRPFFETDSGHRGYLVTWLEGRPFAEARPHTRELLFELGSTTAAVDAALREVQRDVPLIASPWDLRRGHEVVEALAGFISGQDQRDLVYSYTRRYCDAVLPVLDDLPQQVIHNDLNDYNLLVRAGDDGLQLSGVLDVGDAHLAPRVADLAIASAYAALHWNDPVGAVAAVVQGYNAVLLLRQDELRVALPMVIMRLCVSVCVSAYRQKEEDADSYVTISQSQAWETLDRLLGQSVDLGHYRIRAACGLEPCPRSEEVRTWIDRHETSFAAVCRHDLGGADSLTLDLSVSSPADYVLVDEPNATKAIAAAMEQAGADVAVGRYNEVRLAYDSPLFKAASLEGEVQRTVHLGADVFLEVGEPVFAPYDGTVFGLADNEDDLSYGPTVVVRHEPDDGPGLFTLYGHLRRTDLEKLKTGDRIKKGEVVGHVGAASENGGWTPHLHFQIIVDMLGRDSDFPGVCSYHDRKTWTSISPSPYPMLGISDSIVTSSEIDRDRLVEKRVAVLAPSLSVSYDEPLVILRAAGAYMFDETGRRYLDCVNNVNHVGHCHPAVVKAIADQARVLNTNTRYLHPTVLEYGQRLVSKLPSSLSVCFFVNSGSEANDLALRLARTYTRRRDVVVLDTAYHGHLTSLIAISPYKFSGPGGEGPEPGVFVAPLPDIYRGQYRSDDASDRYADAVRDCLDDAAAAGDGAAAFICESLLSCGGQIELPEGFLQQVYHDVRERGGLCIADEVQVGFGRVGSHFWGFETQDVTPDIVTMGKPIGNGHPLGAVVTTKEIADAFFNGMEYFNTYGGNPVSCAAGLTVLDVIERDNLRRHALDVGSYLKRRLTNLQKEAPLIGNVRGRGLFLGIELVLDPESKVPAERQARYVMNRARRLGVLLSTDGPDHNVLKIKPPLVFSHADADWLVDTLQRVLEEDPAQP